jgi:glycerol kinase
MNSAPLALALDLGSTRLKLAALGADGTLSLLATRPAPQTRESEFECDFDALEFDAAVAELLELARAAAPRAPLGLACQRSTLVAWDATTREPLTRALSWRDRRAQAWCATQREREPWLAEYSGLRLSPHHFGPKLAVLAAAGLFAGRRDVRVGTLEAFVLARRAAPLHLTDASMAARTALFDARVGAWNPEALHWVGAPLDALPRVAPSAGRDDELPGGLRVAASLADQAAGFLASAREGAKRLLVNLGTGGFVLRELSRFQPRAGFLCGPLMTAPGGATRWALEGTLNAGAPGLERIGGASAAPNSSDPQPDVHCAPEDGVGAPHWRSDLGPRFSTEALTPDARRRAFLEGLVFRVRELVDALDPRAECELALSGGVARDPFVAPALAALLERPLEVLDDHEATLLGAARLAAGLEACAAPASTRLAPAREHAWLRAKFERWLAWRAPWLAQHMR